MLIKLFQQAMRPSERMPREKHALAQKRVQKKGKSEKKTKRVSAPRLVHSPHLRMSPAARSLTVAMVDAHSARGLNPKILSGTGIPTQPVPVRQTFEMAIGTGGFGWVCFCPRFTGNADSIQYTTAAYASVGTSLNRASTAVTGVTGLAINGPYNSTVYSNGLQARLVSATISGSYSGTLLNRSGTAVSFAEPRCQSIDNVSFSSAENQLQAILYPTNATTAFHVTVHPVMEFQRELSDVNSNSAAIALQEYPGASTLAYYDYSSTTASASSPAVAAVWVSGLAGTTYRCEVTYHYEYAGAAVGSLATPSPCDGIGALHAQELVHKTKSIHAANPHVHPKDCLSSAVADVGVHAIDTGLHSMQASSDPYVAGAGMIGSELMKIGGPMLKKKGGREIEKVFARFANIN